LVDCWSFQESGDGVVFSEQLVNPEAQSRAIAASFRQK
jgi:hypothetical protein